MSRARQIAKRKAQSGAALLIAIFALLLISVVAIALVVTSGTDAALAGNYRTSAGAYYAGVAGLEEARGRLSAKNPKCLIGPLSPNCPAPPNPAFIASLSGLPNMALTDVSYILNPANGEVINPMSADPLNYPDAEYQSEFGWPLTGAMNTTLSVSPLPDLPGPSYKWVRMTPATEKSLNMDVNGDGTKDPVARLYFEPSLVDNSCNPNPGLVPEGYIIQARCGLPQQMSPTPNAAQVLEITSLAVLPNGARRMLQYVVSPVVMAPYVSLPAPSTGPNFLYAPFAMPPGSGQPTFPAALTLLGSNPNFQVTAAPSYSIDGRDACSGTTPQAAVNSIGYTNSADYATILGQVNPYNTFYPGYPLALSGGTYKPTAPSLPTPPYTSPVSPTWLRPSTLDAVVQTITNNADVVLTGPATSANISALAPNMSATNPMTIVVNGDLTLNANIGYGLLLVTGTLSYQPFASWNGLILVIGKGAFVYNANGGSGGIQGAVVVAATRDASGNLLPGAVLGPPSFTSLGSNTNLGIIYNSCWTQVASASAGIKVPLNYKVLSFREIPLTN
jgi:hypothetical protein